ncbi:hypothetical protein CV093_05295 [Oceanobacillus sp. 143]|nr:hypothetical protein CV093_05295 [Oceanobacillus sp. 143]
MKKIITLLLLSIALTGCSFIEETNDTLNYATEATEYLNDLSNFTEETSGLVNQAVSDPAAKEELETQLITLENRLQILMQSMLQKLQMEYIKSYRKESTAS